MGLARPDPNDIIAELQKRYDAAIAAGADSDQLFDVIDEWLIEIGAEPEN